MNAPGAAHLVITFPTTHAALKFESVFQDRGPARLIPVPRELSSSCGLAARLPAQDAQALAASLAALGVEYEEIYRLEPGRKPVLLVTRRTM